MATSLSAKQQKELRQEKLIQEEIDFALKEIGRELYAFNDSKSLQVYLKEKFGDATTREMVRVLTNEVKDELCSNEQKLADVYEVLQDTKTAFSLLIPEPVTLAWNTDQLPERLSPKEKDFIVGTYNELMGTKI